MLKVNRLSRGYDDFMAVDDVSFKINKGEIVGLLGHNGAGKTTVMKVLSGYLEPNQGQITINNTDISVNSLFVQKYLGYLPENLPVYPEMSVADYLNYAAILKGLTSFNTKSEIHRVVKATDLGSKLLDPIATLSRGFRQRVGVAQAILGKPKLLILDEPTNGLDPTQTEHMRQLIRDLAKDATVILSTHIMQEVEAICDRVLILNRGKLAVDAKLDTLRKSNYILLSTSMPEDKAKLLNEIQGIEKIEFLNKDTTHAIPINHYRLFLSESDAVIQVSSAIAKLIVTKEKFELYSLKSEKRDLETLFKEVSNAHSIPSDTNNENQESDIAA